MNCFWIGFKLVRPGFQKRSELKFDGRTNPANKVLRDLQGGKSTVQIEINKKTQEAQRTEIRWSKSCLAESGNSANGV